MTVRTAKPVKRAAAEISITGLEIKLLAIGGISVCFPAIEDDLGKITTRGRAFSIKGVKRMTGDPSQCHSNTGALYEANRHLDLKIATGYALSADGIWRPHSWGILDGKNVVETTESRTAYFGFVLNEAEADEFCFDNY